MSDINDKLVKMRDGLVAVSTAVQAIADQPAPMANWSNIQGTPTSLQGYGITNAFDGDYENLFNKPASFSGSYNDLTDQPSPLKAHINDRELSGNKIHGGLITLFKSVGVTDTATATQLLVDDTGITTDNVDANTISAHTVTGALNVQGLLTVERLEVTELSVDVRNERSSSLEFIPNSGSTIAGKGLLWRDSDTYTKQLVWHENPDRIFSTENIDLSAGKHFSIGTIPVLTEEALGVTVVNSSLQSTGVLNSLEVNGNVTIDQFIFWESESNRLGIGTDAPNAALSIVSLDAEFIVEPEGASIKMGAWTNNDLDIITDDQTRLSIKANGVIQAGTSEAPIAVVKVFGQLGIGVNNIDADVTLSTSGPVKLDGRKMQSGATAPSAGIYALGDIVWNSNPRPTGYVGWICTRGGTPGTWKAFGSISS
tara:strand:+ start:829 stop:2106 length:1278 start_codon:yes stop_codon:yes gene_type:complete